MASATFAIGATAVRRDVLDGRVWSAAAHRVLDDDGQRLTLCCWPGVTTYAPTTWIEWLGNRDDAIRKQGIPDLATGRWDLGEWIWRDTVLLTWVGLDPDFSVQRFQAVSGGSTQWKINFERPVRRTTIGIDTFDLLLDLIADPACDRWSWKDEDEYDQARRLGVITDADHRRVGRARHRAVHLVETRGGPLAQDWSTWRPDSGWPTPVLPSGVKDAGAAR
ncbi:DUF402 domain-containing protein [Actinoplanes regularis]|uniref:DUF402 domain-containing protein n=1 Tax=Actinoplanes regularis TaxID=52697 RepID=UPI0024A54A70|nr:DUF402 domain-containing protein [Actinoplanes regularis]GLW29127.1 hypothetical protein Areg01_20670 [Actinoplanes regularis]